MSGIKSFFGTIAGLIIGIFSFIGLVVLAIFIIFSWPEKEIGIDPYDPEAEISSEYDSEEGSFAEAGQG